MNEEQIITDLFDAARMEKAVRPLKDVEQFVQSSTTGASSSLIVKWLKQNKMNMLITTSGILISATVFLFSQQEVPKEDILPETVETLPM